MPNNVVKFPISEIEAFQILCETKMKPFDKFDKEMFAGAESENPLIGENEDTGLIVIIDGCRLSFYTSNIDDNHYEFSLFHV